MVACKWEFRETEMRHKESLMNEIGFHQQKGGFKKGAEFSRKEWDAR